LHHVGDDLHSDGTLEGALIEDGDAPDGDIPEVRRAREDGLARGQLAAYRTIHPDKPVDSAPVKIETSADAYVAQQ